MGTTVSDLQNKNENQNLPEPVVLDTDEIELVAAGTGAELPVQTLPQKLTGIRKADPVSI
jgi:hypothetical protein